MTGILLGMIIGRIHILKIEIKLNKLQKFLSYGLGMAICIFSIAILQMN